MIILRVHGETGLRDSKLEGHLKAKYSKELKGHIPSRRTINNILNAREALLTACTEVAAKHLRNRFQVVDRAEHPEEEADVWEWFKEHRNRGIPVTGDMLKTQVGKAYLK